MQFFRYIAVVLSIVACGTGGDDSATETTTTTIDETTITAEGTTTTGFSTSASLPEGFPVPLLEEIVADAAHRTGVPMSEIEVASVEAMTFNDAALGCPEPDRMYAQVLTSGFIVLLEAGGGAELDYRVAEGSDSFKLCE